KRTAIGWGLDWCGSLSGTVGMPDDMENRTVIGVDGRAAWGARVRSAAPGAGTNVPAYIVPLACTGRNPGWTPPDSVSSTASRSVMRVVATAKTPESGWGRSKPVPVSPSTWKLSHTQDHLSGPIGQSGGEATLHALVERP